MELSCPLCPASLEAPDPEALHLRLVRHWDRQCPPDGPFHTHA